jgi:hypothetical protein
MDRRPHRRCWRRGKRKRGSSGTIYLGAGEYQGAAFLKPAGLSKFYKRKPLKLCLCEHVPWLDKVPIARSIVLESYKEGNKHTHTFIPRRRPRRLVSSEPTLSLNSCQYHHSQMLKPPVGPRCEPVSPHHYVRISVVSRFATLTVSRKGAGRGRRAARSCLHKHL